MNMTEVVKTNVSILSDPRILMPSLPADRPINPRSNEGDLVEPKSRSLSVADRFQIVQRRGVSLVRGSTCHPAGLLFHHHQSQRFGHGPVVRASDRARADPLGGLGILHALLFR